MSTHFAAVLARTSKGWIGREVDMTAIADLDELADEMRDVAGGGTAVLFLEEDDEYLAIVRVDGDKDPRTFISDDRAVGTSALAELVMQDIVPPEPVDEDDDDEGIKPEPEAVGDTEIVADLGISSAALLDLCAEEGYLPSDMMTAICEKAGCVDVLEEVRGT
ncbi:MAG TPA: tRNA adenosine deaminase-associated protein [Mycobacteriales bacterium]|nr:tRNA adenosine deaminase-associated protein [Mycobacteriales bacterium]